MENIGKIISIDEKTINLKLDININEVNSIVNKYVVIKDNEKEFLGEVSSAQNESATIILQGEIVNNSFKKGVINVPSFSSKIRLLNSDELYLLTNENKENATLEFGKMVLYDNTSIKVDLNDFFSNHFAIFGNTGSGKSCSISRIFQNMFLTERPPYMANILMFDAYGEYKQAFSRLNEKDPYINFKVYTTNVKELEDEETSLIRIPLWLLGIDDIALLLGATSVVQIPIIEKALKLVTVFSQNNETAIKHKNTIIAKALLDILTSGKNSSHVRDQVIAILTSFNTEELNLESKIVQPGYIRTLRQCLIIDRDGKLNEMQLVIQFIESFIDDSLELKLPDGSFPYTLEILKDAFEFSMISEGILKSDKVYDYTNVLRVRLEALINSEQANYFKYPNYITREDYIKELIMTKSGKKAQIIDFNISYVDDRFAKALTKIYSKLIFDYSTSLKIRGSLPFHIILEEAHRYVQKDIDIELLGYNIFERIAKEGRKYGVILGLISQRPSELSETVLSQGTNFLIFRMMHPVDLKYISQMIPNITDEIVSKLKNIQVGTCIAFGVAFKLPMILAFDLPDPTPNSDNCNISKTWFVK